MSRHRRSDRVHRRLAALMIVPLMACSACSPDGPGQDPGSRPSDGPTSMSASSDAAGTAVDVFEVGDTPQGERLYRERRRVPAEDPIAGAAAVITEGEPRDPDYRSLWPRGRARAITVDDAAITLEVPDASWLEAGGLSPGQASLAVEQMVRTLQAASGTTLPLRVRHDGAPAATLLGVSVGDGLRPGDDLDVLALMSITEPAEGAVVDGDRLRVTGRGSSFEGVVPWEVRAGAGTEGAVRLDGFTSADGWVDGLYPYAVDVDISSLRPGRYTLVVSTDDPSGDAEGAGPTRDTRTFVVR